MDKQYKNDMEEFESIKKLTHRVVTENSASATLISTWKSGIRDILVEVREQFNTWITEFTNKFVAKLNKIEQTRELVEYADTDRFVQASLKDLEHKYTRILKIFESIQRSDPDKKLDAIQSFKKEMKDIESSCLVIEKQMKSSVVKIKKALKETVDLDNLGLKMLLKY